jgi:hypothetical protein
VIDFADKRLSLSLWRDLLVGKLWYFGAFARVFDRDGANLALVVEIQKSIFIQIFRLCNFARTKLDVKRIGILKVFYFHGWNVLSKNALCTVS